MIKTLDSIEQFPDKLIKSTKISDKKSVEKIISDIERIRLQNPATYDENRTGEYLKRRSQVLKELVESYFTEAMSVEFPLISDELFNLKRVLTLEYDGVKWQVTSDDAQNTENETLNAGKIEESKIQKVTMPLFAYTPLFDGKHVSKLAEYAKDFRRTELSAKLPGVIGPNLKEASRNALSHYFGILKEMFANPVASDILYSEGKFDQPEIGAIWIPTPQSINIEVKDLPRPVNKDPAMILTARKKRYLVKTWNVDDEEPFESHLREFTTGKLEGKLRGL